VQNSDLKKLNNAEVKDGTVSDENLRFAVS
jgi:hypothetical protein